MRNMKPFKLFVFSLMSIMFIILLSTQIYGATIEDEWAGYWTYKNTILVEYSNELNNYYGSNSDDTQLHQNVSPQKVDYRFNYTGAGYQADLYDEAINDPEAYQYKTIILPGEYAYVEFTFTEPLKQYRENAAIKIDVTADIYDSKIFHFDDIDFTTIAWTNVYDPGEITFDANKDISNNVRIPSRLDPLFFEVSPVTGEYSKSGSFTGLTPYGINDGDIMTIELDVSFWKSTDLIYYDSWSPTEVNYSKIKIYHVYTWKYGTTGIFVGGNAADFPGEDNGINVPIIVITGVFGALAAITAAGMQSGYENPSSKFKMYIQKDFGSAIRYDKPPVTLYARMAEITEDGTEIDRPDLTEDITINSGGNPIEIGDVSLAGNYMGGLISASSTPGENKDKGVVSVRYTGEGGFFQNDITFRLVGKPYIEHENISKYSGTAIVEMIFVDGIIYEALFEPKDFVNIPEVTIQGTDEVDAKLEKLENGMYKALLENRSTKREEKQTVTIQIKAETEDELAESEMTVILYPEGISIEANYDEEKHIIIHTEENESEGSLDPKIKASRIKVTLALIDNSGEKPKAVICDMKEVSTNFSPLTGDSDIAINLSETFKYKINDENKAEGIFFFEPEVTLAELDNGKLYIVKSSVSCTYKGQTCDKEISYHLVGEKPDPRGDYDKEHELLIRTINRYGLSANGDAKELLRSTKNRTATELCMIRRAIIIESAYYYTAEAKQFSDLESKLAKLEFVFSIIKFFGDQAFSYLITAYGGGPAVDAFMSPLKDYFTEFIGEVGAKLYWGEKIDFSSVNLLITLENGVENSIVNMLTGEEKPTPKKIGALVAGFAMLNFSKHYYYTEDSKGDIYKTLVNMGGDITVNGMKALASQYIGKYLDKNPEFKKKIENWLGTYITNNLEEIDNFEFLKKYVEETIGLVVSNVYQNTTSIISDPNGYEITISVGSSTIQLNVMENIKNIANFFYQQFISILSLPTNSPNQPQTPPYIKS